jgi:DNA invertase Pin-like site-specific DNA recombinase
MWAAWGEDMTKTARVVGYARVSTQEQAAGGVSLDQQEAAIRAYCAMRGLELVAVVIDAGVSAGKLLASREGGRRVLELVAREGASGVVAYKLDRLFRDCADCLCVVRKWDDRNVALHLVDLGGQTVDTSTAMGRFFLTVMAGAAELERGLVGERTAAAKAHKRARGEYNGGRCRFGFAVVDGGKLEPVAHETAAMDRARQLRGSGMSLGAVADQLADEGHVARSGRRLDPKSIARWLAA